MTSEHDAAAPPQIDFVTLGMFIIGRCKHMHDS